MQEKLEAAPSRGEEFRTLLPFPLWPEPTNAKLELPMTCAHEEPVNPEFMHEAAADVWMFLLKLSLNWQYEGRKVRGAGASSQPRVPRTPTAAQQAAIHH